MTSVIRGSDNFDSGVASSTTYGEVGTHAILQRTTSNTTLDANTNYAGSGLKVTGMNQRQLWGSVHSDWPNGASPSGTWRSMSTVNAESGWYAMGLFVRIS